MLKEGRFGLQEAIWLSTITISSKVFYTSPAILIGFVGTAGWYMTLISALTATLGFTFIFLLLRRYPGCDLVEIFELTLGRLLGFVFSAAVGGLLLFNASATIREFTEVLKIYVLPTTPPQFIILGFSLTVGTVSVLGLETIARTAKFFVGFLLASFAFVLLLASNQFDVNQLFPLLGNGIGPTITHGLMRSSAYGEVILLAIVAKSLQNLKTVKKAGYISLILSGILISVSILSFSLTFPYYIAREITAPMYQMGTMISYGRFLQRIEPIFLYIWLLSSYISVTAMFYGFLSIYCKIFWIDDLRPIVIPASVILYSFSILPADFSSVVYGSVQSLRNYGWIVYFVLPLIALVIAVLTNKKAGKGQVSRYD